MLAKKKILFQGDDYLFKKVLQHKYFKALFEDS